MIENFNFIDIIKINVLIYYYLIRKKNKLFSLIINKIYNIFKKNEIILQLQRDNRISINNVYLYNFKIKYNFF